MSMEKSNSPIEASPNARNDASPNTNALDPSTMIILKLLFFFYYASVSCINPFLSVYYSSLGMSSDIIGILAALTPCTAFLVTPIWGVVADRSGAKMDVLLVAVTFATIMRTCLLLPGTTYAWFLSMIVILTSLFMAPIKSLNDSVVMSFLPKGQKSIYGKIREWGPAGKMISSPLMAYIVSHSKNGFQIAFGTSALLSIPVIVCHLNLRKIESSSSSSFSNNNMNKTSKTKVISLRQSFGILRKNKALLRFFGILFLFGSSFGLLEAFVYVHIKSIFSNRDIPSNWTMTICRVCVAFGGIVGFRICARLMKQYGTITTLYLTMMSLSCCYYLYASAEMQFSTLYLQCILFVAEIIRAASFSIVWSVSTIHVNMLSDPSMSSSALAFMDAVYTGLGKTLGCSLGGKAISSIGGISITFFYISYILGTLACILLWNRDVSKKKKE